MEAWLSNVGNPISNPVGDSSGIFIVIPVRVQHSNEPPEWGAHNGDKGLPGDRFITKAITWAADTQTTRCSDFAHGLLRVTQGNSYADAKSVASCQCCERYRY